MPDGYFVARLGHTHDPTELIRGDPEAILGTAETMTRFGGALATAGAGLQAIDDGGWTGNAADKFHEAFDTEPARWKKSGDAFLDAADALTTYALVLVWAQGQAKEAIALWDQAQAATDTARADYDAKVDQFVEANPNILGPTLPFHDPGYELRVKAQAILDRAEQQLDEAGDDAERIVAKARDKAPPKPKWWQQVGDFLAEVGKGFAESLLDTLKGLWESHPVRFVVDPVGYIEDTQTRIQAAQYAIQHPAEFAKAVTDWETWKDNPGRAIGHLLPDLAGRGIGRATKAGKAAKALDKPTDAGKKTDNPHDGGHDDSRDRDIADTQEQGHKINPDKVVHIGRDQEGKIIWLESGNERSGLQHMMTDQRAADFEGAGIAKGDIGHVAFEAATEGKPVGITGRDRVVYEIPYNGETKYIGVSVGNNGYIIGANPVTDPSKIKPFPDSGG